jgi:DNA-binding protein WhiA
MKVSFTQRVREELISGLPTKDCCRRSVLFGLLINSDLGMDGSVYVRLVGRSVAELALKYLHDCYGRDGVAEYQNSYGRVSCDLSFSSEKLSEKLRLLSGDGESLLSLLKCKDCTTAFLGGLLLAASTFSDPDRESRLEIRINDPQRAGALRSLFESLGHTAGVSERDGISSLIFKRAEDVEDILTMSGAVSTAMELMQGKLMRELRGEVNRKSNCEVRNIGRATAASSAQLEAVRLLIESGNITLLPDELQETARLRAALPELSLSELAARHTPPISKSGLNHRMQKILALAKKIKEENQ